MKRLLYNLQVFLAHLLLPRSSSPASVCLDMGIGRWVEVALCRRTPYYNELLKNLKDAQEFWGLKDEVLKPYEIRFVPDYFDVVVSHEPWEVILCLGVVAMDVREIRVSLQGDAGEEHAWWRTLAHEFGHLYCHEHPELDVGWDPTHKCSEVWARANSYQAK